MSEDRSLHIYDGTSVVVLLQLTRCLEQAKRSLRVDPPLESLESVVESLNRLNNERQAAMECCTHTDREGYALLNQLK